VVRIYHTPVRPRARIATAPPPRRAGAAAAVLGAVAITSVLVWVSLRTRERRAVAAMVD
jgi:hypothetical protein